jgi:hypothetical protein
VYDPVRYKIGTRVRIGPRAELEEFQRTWEYHDKLESLQLAYADREGVVQQAGIYFGGDVLYVLTSIPGVWHERCLKQVQD